MKLFHSKKGTITETVMEPPLIMALVIFALVSVTGTITGYVYTDNGFERSYLAIHSGTAIEALMASRVNMVFDSGVDTLGYTLNFSNGESIVFDQSETENPPETEWRKYAFVGDDTIKFTGGMLKPKLKTAKEGEEAKREIEKKVSLRFIRQGDEIIIVDKEQSDIEPNLNKLHCLHVNTKGDAGTKLVSLPSKVLKKEELSDEALKNEIKNADVAVKLYRHRSEDNTIVAYISASPDNIRQNKKFACLLLNQLTDNDELNEKIKISNIAIVPTNNYGILNVDNLAVLLDFRMNPRIENELNTIKKLIENAIKKYYS